MHYWYNNSRYSVVEFGYMTIVHAWYLNIEIGYTQFIIIIWMQAINVIVCHNYFYTVTGIPPKISDESKMVSDTQGKLGCMLREHMHDIIFNLLILVYLQQEMMTIHLNNLFRRCHHRVLIWIYSVKSNLYHDLWKILIKLNIIVKLIHTCHACSQTLTKINFDRSCCKLCLIFQYPQYNYYIKQGVKPLQGLQP